jgi:hypothetical protein
MHEQKRFFLFEVNAFTITRLSNNMQNLSSCHSDKVGVSQFLVLMQEKELFSRNGYYIIAKSNHCSDCG